MAEHVKLDVLVAQINHFEPDEQLDCVINERFDVSRLVRSAPLEHSMTPGSRFE